MNFNYLKTDSARMNSDVKEKKKTTNKIIVINIHIKMKYSSATSLKLKV